VLEEILGALDHAATELAQCQQVIPLCDENGNPQWTPDGVNPYALDLANELQREHRLIPRRQ
jgi:hypothetical protein